MNNLNFVNLIGRLTADPEVRTTANGKGMVTNSIAVQRNYKNKDGNYDADFINVIFSGKTADFVAQHFKKGDVISVTGSISVTTKETEAGKRTYTNVIGENVAFVPGAKSSGSSGNSANYSTPANTAATATQPAQGAPSADSTFVPAEGTFPGFDDDDGLPF